MVISSPDQGSAEVSKYLKYLHWKWTGACWLPKWQARACWVQRLGEIKRRLQLYTAGSKSTKRHARRLVSGTEEVTRDPRWKEIIHAIPISLSASIYHFLKSPSFWDHDRRFRTSWWLVDQVQQLTFKGWLIWAAVIPLMATRAETWESTSGQNSIPSQARLSKCCLEHGADLKRNYSKPRCSWTFTK